MSYDYTRDDYDPDMDARRRLAQFDESIDAGTPDMALGLSALVHELIYHGAMLQSDTGTIADHAEYIGNVLERHPEMGPDRRR